MRSTPVFLVAALALAACQGAAPGGEGATPAAPGASSSAPTAADVVPLWNAGAVQPLHLQVAHENGVVLQVNSLQSRETSTVVGVRIVNGRDQPSQLNWSGARKTYILLDNGERLYLSPPAANQYLEIPPHQTFEGELVFIGRLPPVRSAQLIFNDGDSGGQYTANPAIRIDLPLAPAAGPAPAAPVGAQK